MNINNFLTRFSSVLLDDKDDQTFETLKLLTAGTTGSRIAKLINFAVSCTEESECYLEVGVFTGYTLIAANYQNRRNCIGIDSFQSDQIFSIKPEDVRAKCMFNLKNYTTHAMLIDGDFRAVPKEQIKQPVGVHFIDGDHNYKAVKDGLEWIKPMLTKDAIVILDDLCYPDIFKAVIEAAIDPDFELIFFHRPLYVSDSFYPVGDRVLHMGLAILRYKS
jgi:predicted O-methyltransferase YrrM